VSAADWTAFASGFEFASFRETHAATAKLADDHQRGIGAALRNPKHDWPFVLMSDACAKMLTNYMSLPSNRLIAVPKPTASTAFCLAPNTP
jgi:hypothetical protein